MVSWFHRPSKLINFLPAAPAWTMCHPFPCLNKVKVKVYWQLTTSWQRIGNKRDIGSWRRWAKWVGKYPINSSFLVFVFCLQTPAMKSTGSSHWPPLKKKLLRCVWRCCGRQDFIFLLLLETEESCSCLLTTTLLLSGWKPSPCLPFSFELAAEVHQSPFETPTTNPLPAVNSKKKWLHKQAVRVEHWQNKHWQER